ncbi:hypothetical protein ACQBAR_14040 [Propionibacteriaceae bacterium Y1685]
MSQSPYGQGYGQQAYGPNQYDANQYGAGQYDSGQYGAQPAQNPYEAPVQQYQPYAQPSPYGTAQVAPPHPQATMIMVLGILSVVGFSITGPFAWYMGSKALKEVDADNRVHAERGSIVAGKVMGIIGSVLLVFVVIYLIFVFGIMFWSLSQRY